METTEVEIRGGGSEGASTGSGSSESSGSGGGGGGGDDKTNFKKTDKVEAFEYSGWVYHLGVNSIGHEYCHLRFLLVRGSSVQMYKRDPAENPGTKPIRRGAVGHTLMVEELGRRKLNHGEVYVLRFYNRLDETKKGEIACATAGEVRNWREAFDHAKQVADSELARGGGARTKLNMGSEIDLDGHRPRVRRYTKDLKKLIKIGHGPEMLLRQSSNQLAVDKPNACMEGDGSDVIEAHDWRCIRTINGVRILEDAANNKSSKGVLIKAVAVVDASADTVFEVILSLDPHKRYEWDTLTGNLELLDSLDGHYDVVYGTFDQKYSTWWQSKKRDFVFSRQWFNGQDGAYTILQFPAKHKSRPPKSGYRRTKINPSTWEIRDLKTPSSLKVVRCLVTQMLEVSSKRWFTWRNNQSSRFEKSVSYALLSQVAGLKEYVGANPTLAFDSQTTIVQSKLSDSSETNDEFEDSEGVDQFYDAIATGSSSSEDDDSDDDTSKNDKARKIKLKNVAWALAGMASKRTKATDVNKEFKPNVPAVNIDPSQFKGSMRQGKSDVDNDCWTSPNGSGFMIRGETYLKDSNKVSGGVPLLKLIAVDWFKVEDSVSQIALHPQCLVQSDIGKKVPFILVINLQVPAKPNYSLVLYFAADKPVNKNSLLGRFIDGTDMFRDSRFKLIPSIAEGYWMVKRAVGNKACLLGKAVTCKYLRQDNFLEIDVDIGSSSVARSIINLVLGYVTSIVVDLAIVIEAKEATELPEYILGSVRLNRVRVDSAVPLET